MIIELCCTTETLLNEISNKECKRNDIAQTYALAIMSSENTDFIKVNNAIIMRWSMSGLEYIKKRAWGIINGKVVHMPELDGKVWNQFPREVTNDQNNHTT